MAPLWTLLVIGPPTSGKSSLSRRLLQSIKGSVRINPDEVRLMLFNDPVPEHDEELVYRSLIDLRDISLAQRHSVIIDCTAPRRTTREFLLSGSARSRHLIVIMDVDKKILQERAREENKLRPLRAFEEVWQEPHNTLPLFKFKNDNKEQFETSFYLLMEYINHEYTQHNSVIRNLFRRGRKDEVIPEPTVEKLPLPERPLASGSPKATRSHRRP
jgi:predicted kinase